MCWDDVTEIWAIIHHCCQFYRTSVSIAQVESGVSRASRLWESRSGSLVLAPAGNKVITKCCQGQAPPNSSHLHHFTSSPSWLFLPLLVNWSPWLCPPHPQWPGVHPLPPGTQSHSAPAPPCNYSSVPMFQFPSFIFPVSDPPCPTSLSSPAAHGAELPSPLAAPSSLPQARSFYQEWNFPNIDLF